MRWHGYRLGAGQANILGGGAPRALPLCVPGPHALTHARLVHALPHGIDDTRAIAVGDQLRPAYWPAATSRFDIRWVDRRSMKAYAHFTRSRLGIRQFAHPHHLSRQAIFFIPRRTHKNPSKTINYNTTPTTAPANSVASVPDTMERMPSDTISSRRSGAMVAMPPMEAA